MKFRSPFGFALSGIYVVLCVYLIATQGLFGESFIALLLGLPWSMLPAFFEFGGAEGVWMYILIFAPLVLNTLILYAIGAGFGRLIRSRQR